MPCGGRENRIRPYEAETTRFLKEIAGLQGRIKPDKTKNARFREENGGLEGRMRPYEAKSLRFLEEIAVFLEEMAVSEPKPASKSGYLPSPRLARKQPFPQGNVCVCFTGTA